MTTEKKSSPEEKPEATKSLRASSVPAKQCSKDEDCPPGERCVNGECVPA